MSEAYEGRLAALEAKVDAQSAHIAALRIAMADLLVAYSLKANDANLFASISAARDHDLELAERAERGGRTHVGAEYFRERGHCFAFLLEEAAQTDLFERYWLRSAFPWIDERRYQRIQKARVKVQRFADR